MNSKRFERFTSRSSFNNAITFYRYGLQKVHNEAYVSIAIFFINECTLLCGRYNYLMWLIKSMCACVGMNGCTFVCISVA